MQAFIDDVVLKSCAEEDRRRFFLASLSISFLVIVSPLDIFLVTRKRKR